MSDIAAIRSALATVLSGVTGIRGASGYPPDSIGPVPYAFCGLNDVSIDYTAGMEVNEHTLQVIVLVDRVAGRLPANLAAVETLEAAFRTAMRSNFGLGGVVNGAMLSRIQQDTVQIGQTSYIGFIATLDITDKFGVTLT